MKVKTLDTIPTVKIQNAQASGVTGRILLGKADGAPNFCMRLFELDKGGFTPRHRHDWEHEVFVHSGQGAVLIGGHWAPLAPGNSVFIPPNEEHQIKNAGNTPLVFICVIPSSAPEL